MPPRAYRARQSLEDYFRACKTDRVHTATAGDGAGRPTRVTCGYCGSEHNFRGGPRLEASPGAAAVERRNIPDAAPRPVDTARAGRPAARPSAQGPSASEPFPIVSERERS